MPPGWTFSGNSKFRKKGFAQSGEINNNNISQVSTIYNWIGRYSREFYHEGTLIALEIFNADGSSSNGEL
ncbi:17299_t:CDS:2 [Cetraspora pellucida]|uniref:17299_t:CDS:1 n=1 Tax=Cetraspora pellucida TaxID=1433469 RepID=A0ACA9L3T9_9GLOM|nr:17299_t:CDS:2 [Cetraspora pellucida]